MTDIEQKVRERAYKIWEDEGRVEGAHDDHWTRAQEQHGLAEQESEDVTKVNQEADNAFSEEGNQSESDAATRLPSVSSSD